MNTLSAGHGASSRILDYSEQDLVAGGGPALNWTVGGAVIGYKYGAPAGLIGGLITAAAGAAYYRYYYESTK